MSLIKNLFILSSCIILGACSNGSARNNTLAPNVMQIKVSDPNSLCNRANEPCVSVTICSPASQTQCQTIDNIILDTGSSGLRLYKQVVSVPLESINSASGFIANCERYTGGQSDWGPVMKANLILGQEPAISVPLQIIDSAYAGGAPSGCLNPESSPSVANGTLGIGIERYDCPECAEFSDNYTYYGCTGESCTQITVPLKNQVQNPIPLLPVDNNGSIINLPQIPESGAVTATGTLTLGIGTAINNQPASSVTVYPAAVKFGIQNILTTFNESTVPSYIDSGSFAYFFADPQIEQCESSSFYYCPESQLALTAINHGYNGFPSKTVNFNIINIFNTPVPNNVYNNVGLSLNLLQSNTFVWGFSFFFGKTIYFGIEGQPSTLGMGPYYAY